MATLDELQAQLEELNRRVNEITAPPDDYYTHRFSGEEIDNAVDRVKATPGSGAITAGDVGAAPDGFGLGTAAAKAPTVNDFDSIVQTGWYIGVPAIPGFAFGNTVLMHVAMSSSYATQIAYLYTATSGLPSNTMIIRSKETGTWKPWEWVNPPMKIGVEYRTTKRHNEKPVYTKAINCGAMPNATEKNISHNIDNLKYPLTCNVNCTGGTNFTLPWMTGDRQADALFISSGVRLYSSNDLSAYTAIATLEYTKTTD